MTGCDHIGSINGITKQRSFNTYMQLTGHSWSVRALSRLGNSEHISAIDIEGLTEYVIKIYCSKMKDDETRYTEISDIEQLRWELYSKHQVDGDLLLPTPAALKFKLRRVNYISLVWKRQIAAFVATIPTIEENHGWNIENGCPIAIMTHQLPAPEFSLELAVCKCKKSKCAENRCTS